jgi:hypothetical protein
MVCCNDILIFFSSVLYPGGPEEIARRLMPQIFGDVINVLSRIGNKRGDILIAS